MVRRRGHGSPWRCTLPVTPLSTRLLSESCTGVLGPTVRLTRTSGHPFPSPPTSPRSDSSVSLALVGGNFLIHPTLGKSLPLQRRLYHRRDRSWKIRDHCHLSSWLGVRGLLVPTST